MHWRETLPDWYIKKYGYQPCVNIGTAGHVDHGKTTLIQALTGSWTSVHSQELKRGITIRVGYSDAAFYKCKSCEEPLGFSTTPKCNNCGKESELSRVVSFVDSPGHESLMANMLSGSALMDGALLLVAANEKVPKPQTKEHLLALQTLGIQQIVVVQNKVDLLPYQEVMANYQDITKFVKGTFAAKAPIIPISAQSGLNIDALIGSIESTIKTPERDEKKDTVMHVLRSFDVNKPGIKLKDIKGGVIGGSLTQGVFKIGDEIEIKPGIMNEKKKTYEPLLTEITSLGTAAGIVESVKPGGLVAIGTKLDPSMTRSDSFIGSVIGKPGTLPENSTELKLEVNLFDVAVGITEDTKVQPIQAGELLRLNIGTAPVLGKVTKIKSKNIEIELRRPACIFEGGNVAISRRIDERWRLIGAGIIG
ncbi:MULTISPECIES: translation initiation factor IF-2 subunit gamma [Nitrosopumilus]|uniref:protein-synthesizing GTPase n=1 Tax=Nitrosopumilus zosterae TaxID=718286 RepID=A0A2S2KUB7_9ARCH|nr:MULTISPECIES: translation initiation factor IF-2 subunit gamma [Nitrosopumilus]MCV0366705.1 translation initiation factor IF-2 subunit gamma [Nitrosopumilus sp.]MCV0410628.1 translation initiation factor IF-2 subunit gamma [Nitrosopumilus sp.]BDQ31883.1 translation initiation factor IF-2 subunit gamma [Nitrosopumilus zosterae]GBH35232.1 translation initiation factor IF-2 subunit gamma [Nitrosopumilus zosterae]